MRIRVAVLVCLLAALFSDAAVFGQQTAPVSTPLTLLENDESAIDTALEDKQPGPATQNVYISTTASPATIGYNRFVRNIGLWIGPKVDLTAISAYSDPPDNYGTKFAITAISPLHCLGAAHVAAHLGTHFNFVGADNVTVTRSVVAELNPVDDVEVYLLNQPLPPDVTPLRMLPRNWNAYLRPGMELDMPAIFINQHNMLYCAEAASITPGPNPLVMYHFPSGFVRQQFSTQIISGDSGFPQMLLVNGVPAILSCWHFGGYGIGPLQAAHFDAINMAMRKLSQQFGWPSKYQLQPADMRGIAKLP